MTESMSSMGLPWTKQWSSMPEMIYYSRVVLSNMAALSHMWPLST